MLTDAQCSRQHRGQFLGHRDPFLLGGGIEAVEVRVGFPGGHLLVHPGHGARQAMANVVGIDPGPGIKQGGVAGAHGFAVQAIALQLSRHLHGSVLVP
ncbi:hypothetical protein D3C84_911080 [compost metagenome]